MDYFLNERNKARPNQIHNYFLTDLCASINECDEKLPKKFENYNEILTEFLPFKEKIIRYLKYYNLKLYLCLILISLISSTLCISIDVFSGFIFNIKNKFIINVNKYNSFLGFLIYFLISLLCINITTFICDKYSKEAEGSGIPELKTILSGVHYDNFLKLKTLLIKSIGLILIVIGGFFIGLEGPFIHLSSIVAKVILNLKIFKNLKKKLFYKKQIITAAVAGGVVTTFGTPYGGIMFSIEISTAIYFLSNIWKSFISSTITFILYYIVHNNFKILLFKKLSLTEGVFDLSFHFIILGIICGLICSFYLKLFAFINIYKKTNKYLKNRYIFCSIVSLFISILTYNQSNFWYGTKSFLNNLFIEKILQNDYYFKSDHNDLIIQLFLLLFTRYIIFWIVHNCNIPNGIFAPSVIFGAILGRLYGEVLIYLNFEGIDPRLLSVCGAAAYVCAMTRTSSAVLILLELTGEIHLIFNLILCCFFAYLVSNILSINFFDLVCILKKLPYWPILFSSKFYKKKCIKIKEPVEKYLFKETNLYDILIFLSENNNLKNKLEIPILNSNNQLKYIINYKNLLDYIINISNDEEENNKNNLKKKLFTNFNNLNMNDKNEIKNELKNLIPYLINEEDNNNNNNYNNNIEFEMKDLNLSLNSNSIFHKNSMIHSENRLSVRASINLVNNLKELYSKYKINWEDEQLKIEKFPIIVKDDTKLSKIHYIFQMLGINTIYIEDKDNILIGKISKYIFLSYRYS